MLTDLQVESRRAYSPVKLGRPASRSEAKTRRSAGAHCWASSYLKWPSSPAGATAASDWCVARNQ